MGSFGKELAAIFGQGFDQNSSSSSPSSTNLINTNSIASAVPNMSNDRSSNSPKFHHDQTNCAPILLNFATYPLVNLQQVIQATKKKTRTRLPSQTHDHILAERKRREQLSQLFIALSAIVPGLKKTDKSSILGHAIKYLKHLQEKLETLEIKAANQTMEPVVVVKKSKIILEDEGSCDERSDSSDEQMQVPEIEARAVNHNIIFRIHCGKQKGVLANLLSKVESLNMVVINTNVTPFGSSALDITITAEMEKEFSLTVKEVATVLRAVLYSETE